MERGRGRPGKQVATTPLATVRVFSPDSTIRVGANAHKTDMTVQVVYWGERSIGKIASAIGTPLITDECTTNKLRVSYARVFVEVDVSAELKEEIIIRGPRGSKQIQKVEYEWKPPFCKKCDKIGHECDMKPKQKAPAKQVWTVKQNSEVTEKVHEKPTLEKEVEIQTDAEVEDNPTWIVIGTSKHKGKSIVNEYIPNGSLV
ncbi:hypothetical protein KIW84_062276 [Lathyrus oleraceus]|uniref:Uncharacterized protein n=1 Tax=Pisum sativum TaxID=3888 RepID=A0A9D4W4N1_PEA|nr:hypothetical protein KIW84_062276 [Pisum sativum]